jgi:hypothetical protein
MPAKKKSTFEQLNDLNVNEYTEKKGRFTYLSWAWAVRELLQVAPDATWVIHEWGYDGVSRQPYMQTEAGCFVQVTVSVNGVDRTQVHPVLDSYNKTIEKPNAFEINTSIQRCLAKAIALHGLGLYIYAGEDLPNAEPPLNGAKHSSAKKKAKPSSPVKKKTKMPPALEGMIRPEQIIMVEKLLQNECITSEERIKVMSWMKTDKATEGKASKQISNLKQAIKEREVLASGEVGQE